jgi:hypothetical protein
MNQRQPYETQVLRAALPEVLLAEDVALALGITPSAARRTIRSGAIGNWNRIGRRLCVPRTSFLDAVSRRHAPRLLDSECAR